MPTKINIYSHSIDTTLLENRASRFERMLANIRIKKIISTLIWATFFFFFFEVSALLDVRHCPKLQYCEISRKTNDANLTKW